MSTEALTDLERLRRAVVLFPEEDTPRLIYADELEANDPERAEFIRAQVAGDRRLWARVFEFRDELMALLPPEAKVGGFGSGDGGGEPYWRSGLPGGYAAVFRFTRGFVSRVEMPCAAFMACAAELFAAHPVESVVLTDREPLSVGGIFFCWFNRPISPAPGYFPQPHFLPPELFDHMEPDAECEMPGPGRYRNAALARAALSRRAVEYGRSLVPWLSGGAS